MFRDIPSNATPAVIRRRQAKFVRELMAVIQQSLVNKIRHTEAVPLDWDGRQLRALIAHQAKGSDAYLDRKERREFNRVVIGNNL